MTVREELALRLADVQAILVSVNVDEDSGELQGDAGALLAALDYAVRGASGCLDPDEWRRERAAALTRYATYLSLPEPKKPAARLGAPGRL